MNKIMITKTNNHSTIKSLRIHGLSNLILRGEESIYKMDQLMGHQGNEQKF